MAKELEPLAGVLELLQRGTPIKIHFGHTPRMSRVFAGNNDISSHIRKMTIHYDVASVWVIDLELVGTKIGDDSRLELEIAEVVVKGK